MPSLTTPKCPCLGMGQSPTLDLKLWGGQGQADSLTVEAPAQG